MPLVLAMNDATESGIRYDDVPFVSYEYPVMYRRQITVGERFVFYRGRQRAGGGRQRQMYLGTGVVGPIHPSSRDGRLVCTVLDGTPFTEPVFFRDNEGLPLEPGGVRRGYYQRGVRVIDEETYASIVKRGDPRDSRRDVVTGIRGFYAHPEVARRVEEYSRETATRWLVQNHECRVKPMPLNNPGFDLLTNHERMTFVEVKGTQAPIPRFLLSEGERAFAEREAERFAMIVVYGIGLDSGTHIGIECRHGAVEAHCDLIPAQWAGTMTVGR